MLYISKFNLPQKNSPQAKRGGIVVSGIQSFSFEKLVGKPRSDVSATKLTIRKQKRFLNLLETFLFPGEQIIFPQQCFQE